MQKVSSVLPSGIFAIYKPRGITSSHAVLKVRDIIKKYVKKSVKVGHGGTLDPMAEGILVLGVGDGTKLLSSHLCGSKQYRAKGLLGTTTDTLDSTGKITSKVDCTSITWDDLRSNTVNFQGDILQIPPMYSALHVHGKRLYDLARSGIEVDRPARPITVHKISMIKAESIIWPEFGLDIECGGGCYVRSIIADLCSSCGGAGHMTELIRTKQGHFGLADCLREEDWNYAKICDMLSQTTNIADKRMRTTITDDYNHCS